ncbi:MAG TPA: NAD(P)-binding domain-containing protein [Dongiaceae bacterium]
MKIGIIGAGNIGATLARKLAASGHEVKLANSKGPDTLSDLARDAGATAVTKEQTVQDVSAIVLVIPFGRYPDLAGLFNDVPADVVMIDTSNYYPFRDGAVAEVDSGKPESVWMTEQIGRPVVKAWNAVLAATLAERGRPNGVSERIFVPVAGDAVAAKATAIQLVEATALGAIEALPRCMILPASALTADDAILIALFRRRTTERHARHRLNAEVRASSIAASVRLNPIDRCRDPDWSIRRLRKPPRERTANFSRRYFRQIEAQMQRESQDSCHIWALDSTLWPNP